jgi:hypothetical protein
MSSKLSIDKRPWIYAQMLACLADKSRSMRKYDGWKTFAPGALGIATSLRFSYGHDGSGATTLNIDCYAPAQKGLELQCYRTISAERWIRIYNRNSVQNAKKSAMSIPSRTPIT